MLDATTVVGFCQPPIPLTEGQASVLRYDFSDPQSGKDLCDRKIVPCKQRLPHHVADNQNMESENGIKKGLESPQGNCRSERCGMQDKPISDVSRRH